MAQILKSYVVSTKIINAIMILYRDTKSMVMSPDGDTEYLDINAGILKGGLWHHYCLLLHSIDRIS